MPETEKTAAEIVGGALALIQEHGYWVGLERGPDGEYSLPTAFDEVAFGNANYTNQNFAALEAGIGGLYPAAYYEAKAAIVPHLRPNGIYGSMPLFQDDAERVLQNALDDLNGGNAEVTAA